MSRFLTPRAPFVLLVLLLTTWLCSNFGSLGSAPPVASASGIEWHSNLDEAVAEATKNKRPLLVVFR